MRTLIVKDTAVNVGKLEELPSFDVHFRIVLGKVSANLFGVYYFV